MSVAKIKPVDSDDDDDDIQVPNVLSYSTAQRIDFYSASRIALHLAVFRFPFRFFPQTRQLQYAEPINLSEDTTIVSTHSFEELAQTRPLARSRATKRARQALDIDNATLASDANNANADSTRHSARDSNEHVNNDDEIDGDGATVGSGGVGTKKPRKSNKKKSKDEVDDDDDLEMILNPTKADIVADAPPPVSVDATRAFSRLRFVCVFVLRVCVVCVFDALRRFSVATPQNDAALVAGDDERAERASQCIDVSVVDECVAFGGEFGRRPNDTAASNVESLCVAGKVSRQQGFFFCWFSLSFVVVVVSVFNLHEISNSSSFSYDYEA